MESPIEHGRLCEPSNYIPDKDFNEKMLTENPIPSNLKEVPIVDLENFVKTLLVSHITNGYLD